jgi:hydroxyacylglutathione hydrolase
MLTAQGVHAFSDNYIWLIKQPEKPYIAIVDPGDAAPVIGPYMALITSPYHI